MSSNPKPKPIPKPKPNPNPNPNQVTSNRVVGDAAGDAATRNAFTSYSLVLGVHRVVASNAKDCSLQHIALQPPICD